jgi:membrane-associated phospholipid phosphatase
LNQNACRFHFLPFFFVAVTLLFGGCGTLKNGRGWGEDAFSSSSFERISGAAYRALTDWQTLIPAAGALLLRIDDFDSKISDWAIDHRPVFGSERRARDSSDYIYTAMYLETLGTLLATPSGENREDWVRWKIKGAAVESTALLLTGGVTLGIREATGRESPVGSHDAVFPSGHAGLGFGAIALSHRNLDSISMPGGARMSIKAGNLVLGTAMAWGRIEGGEHFPTDVLVGAALGNFLCSWIHDAFIGIDPESGFGLSIFPSRKGLAAQLSFKY